MSADKDRGIRRIKQKRAKALKKASRQPQAAATATATTAKAPAKRPQ